MIHTFPPKPAGKSWEDYITEVERSYADTDTTQTETQVLNTKLSFVLHLLAKVLAKWEQH